MTQAKEYYENRTSDSVLSLLTDFAEIRVKEETENLDKTYEDARILWAKQVKKLREEIKQLKELQKKSDKVILNYIDLMKGKNLELQQQKEFIDTYSRHTEKCGKSYDGKCDCGFEWGKELLNTQSNEH